MEQALVTVEELAAWLPFEMEAEEEREATGALESLSDDARFYGKPAWVSPDKTPRQVRNLILRAAVRYLKNYEGYTTSRAGDETVGWSDKGEDAGSACFTKREIAVLRELGGNRKSGLHTVGIVAYGSAPRSNVAGLVRDEGSNEQIQMFASEEPW